MTYPLSRYELDQHVDAGLTNLSGTVDAIPHALAAIVWSIDRHIAQWAITLFNGAFNVNLLAGNAPLRIAASATASGLYTHLALPLMTCAILATGIWSIWKLLIVRRYADGVGHIAATLAYSVACLAIILAPQATIGTLADTARDASATMLRATTPSSRNAAADTTDGLHQSLIHEPWILLNFGAAAHCLDADDDDVTPTRIKADGTPVAPRGARCIDTHTLADRFLDHAAGSDERNDAFNDLKDSDDQLRQRSVQIQTASAGYDRVAFALGLFVAAIGAAILIGGLSLGMIAAQLYALILIACAPIAFLASFIPGAGHHIVRVWGTQLIGATFRSCVYCLYLTLAASLSIALIKAAPTIGSVGALTLQATLWWGLIIYGNTLSKRLGERAVATPAAQAATSTAQRITQAARSATRAPRTATT